MLPDGCERAKKYKNTNFPRPDTVVQSTVYSLPHGYSSLESSSSFKIETVLCVNTLLNSEGQVGHPDGPCVLGAGRLPVASATDIAQTVMPFVYGSGVEACSEVTCSGCVKYRTLCASEHGVDRSKTAVPQA
jgi:hypothetical protein